MNDIELLLGLVAITIVLVWVAWRISIPYPIVLVVAGVGIGFLPGVPEIELHPEVVFLIFIPPLVHAAAYTSSQRQLRKLAVPITELALGLVAATAAVVAVVAHELVDGLTWPAAFALGAIVAPTDPVAATAIFRRIGVPPRVATLVEGESLLNDVVALVTFKIAVAAAVAGGYTVLDGGVDLVIVSAAGAVFGYVVAFLAAEARKRVEYPTVEIGFTLITPYVAYIGAEHLGGSGILAAVVSGLYLGWRDPELAGPNTRIQAFGFWEVFTFLLEAVLFILIGLQFPGVLDSLSEFSPAELIGWALAIGAAVILVRIPFVFVIARINRTFDPAVKRGSRKLLTPGERAVVGWSGIRGAVSLAAALSIPLTTDAGAAFPGRDVILFLTLTTIFITLVGQGLTLPAVIRRFKVEDERTGEARRARARFATVQAALDYISDLSFEDGVAPGVVERARNMYTSRARQLAGQCQVGIEIESGDNEAWARLRKDLLRVERQALLDLRDEGRVPHRVVLDVERDLDLEETRLQSQPFAAAATPDPAKTDGR